MCDHAVMDADPVWPWPGETALQRARQVANWILDRLSTADRDDVIRQARAVGETWLGEQLLRWTNTDVVTTSQAAELVQVGASTVRKWHSEGHLPNHQGRKGYYVVQQVRDCAARRYQDRADRAT